MELNDFKKLNVGDRVYVHDIETETIIVAVDFQFGRVLTIDGMLLNIDRIERSGFLERSKSLERILLGADIGVLESRINNLIDSGDESKMKLIKDLLLLKKEKEKQLTNT